MQVTAEIPAGVQQPAKSDKRQMGWTSEMTKVISVAMLCKSSFSQLLISTQKCLFIYLI